jgi:thymidylate synthase ThyX
MSLAADSLREIEPLVLDPVGRVQNNFSSIGRFRGKKNPSADERTILEYFFTNVDSNIYAAKDTLPSELAALLLGKYARSKITAKGRLMAEFKAMEKEGQIDISEFAESIRRDQRADNVIDLATRRAAKKIKDIGITYGHASVRDSGRITMFFEGVSELSTSILESAREGAYQEQSTRAIPFTQQNLGVPYEIRGTEWEGKVAQLDLKLMNLYQKVREGMHPYLKTNFGHLREEANGKLREINGPKFKQISDKDWQSFLEAKGFDVARQLLPRNMTTSLGMVLTTRRFQDQLTEWQSHPVMEIRALGRAAQVEATKISPHLMPHGKPSEFYLGLPEILRTASETYTSDLPSMGPYEPTEPTSRIIGSTPNLESMVLAGALLGGTNGEYTFEGLVGTVDKMGSDVKSGIAQRIMSQKGHHDLYPKIFETGGITFERRMDIGSHKDYKRQRGDRQQKSRFGAVGYVMQPEIPKIGLEREFRKIMAEVKTLYEQMVDAGLGYVAEYIPVMANTMVQVTTRDPVQQFYEAGLRAQPAGHDNYRSIAIQEIEATLDLLPSFKGLIPYDSKKAHPLGRLVEHIEKSRIRR